MKRSVRSGGVWSRSFAIVAVTVAVLGFGVPPGSTGAPGSHFVAVDLGSLGDGGSYAQAINEDGQVVGSTNVAPGKSHPFLWTAGGGMIDLGSLGGPNASALEVNDAGMAVGFSNLPPEGSQSHAFAWTPTGGLVDLGTLDGAWGSSQPYDVSNTGQIVGMSYTALPQRAFSWTQAGAMIDPGTLGGSGTIPMFNTYAIAVNDSGQVVGQSSTPLGARHGFSWTRAGGMVDLGTLGGSSSYAAGVNNVGQIVGYSTTADGQTHAFLCAGGRSMLDLGTLGGTTSKAVAVNDAGLVAGNSTNASGQSHAFLWSAESGMIDLGTLGGGTSSVGAPSMGSSNALSNAGQVVGSSTMTSGPPHAFSWTAATGMVDLGTLGGSGTSEARAVNESGQIVGWSTTAAGGTHATLWHVTSLWTQASPSVSPPARSGASMATDGNGNVVLFGGSAAESLGDTWIWNGADWSQPALAAAPSARSRAAMASAGNGKVVLFGGIGNQPPMYPTDTWVWDGAAWAPAYPATSPLPRTNAGMAVDKGGKVVLFGGILRSDLGGAVNDTWLWDGATWTQASPGTSPSPRYNFALATDKNGNVVLFGGFSSTSRAQTDETWLWDGANWSRVFPAVSPSARTGGRMASDRDGNVVLFGGSSEPTGLVADTWIWDGSTWARASSIASPSARSTPGMATDRNGKIVLFSGFRYGGILPDDTWLFDSPGKVDTTAPAASPTQAPSANANGWNNTDVVVAWHWADEAGGSGIDAAHCITSSSSSGQGTIVLDATCNDVAGNTGSSTYTVKVDTSAPQLAPGNVTVNATSPTGATVTYTVSATDLGGSGVSSVVCTPLPNGLFAIGETTVDCAAADRAGNTSSAHFTVHVSGAAEQLAVLLTDVTGVGPGQALTDTIGDAQRQLEKNHTKNACDLLDVFIHQVNNLAQGKKPQITATQAESLTAQASNIQATLGC